MSFVELKSALSLTLVFMLRMLGLFMVLPVLALFAEDLQGASPATIGLAIGAYGFTQALLQIPFGWLSDRFGRKPVIFVGLLIFLLGSLVAANADSIQGIITGRILQGAGAIAGAVTALLADLTRDQHRTKAMAMIGMGIGLAFCIAMVLGPLISGQWGLSGLFLSNAAMAVSAMIVLFLLVPTPVQSRRDLNCAVKVEGFKGVFANTQLIRHIVGIFSLHFVLMALFVMVPGLIESSAGLAPSEHGWVYLVVMVGSLATIIPFIIYSEKHRQLKRCYSFAVSLLIIAFVLIYQGRVSSVVLYLGLFVFFAGFNFLEASLPSLVSKLSPAGTRGTAMGVYSTGQFLGAALGGGLGGLAMQHWGVAGVLILCTTPTALWWWLSVTMKQPPYVSSMVMALKPSEEGDAYTMSDQLAVIQGVREVTVLAEERTAYLKVDKHSLDWSALKRFGEC
ncbi:hypothetical protein ACH42_02165 [Endozoicomonas sp. (ex Bugula neritina AB1)]|nr:hypothetical protein ACH42_02165 [Endozoicomonas sp. (ex Bugula neritina AB1)]